MRYRPLRLAGFAILSAALLVLLTPMTALAHKEISVAGYDLEIGFNTEPAVQGGLNGLFLSVVNSSTGEPVTNLSSTLQAEVSFGDAKRIIPLEPQEAQDGTYVAWMVPTDVGSYTWRVYGTIEGKPIDESASSGPDSFNAVQPVSDLAFPGTSVGGSSSLEPQIAALHDQLDAAKSAANTARWIGLAGVVLGVLGIAAAGVLALRRRA